MLTDDQRTHWEAYEAAEGRSPRAEKLRSLQAFLDTLESSPPTAWHPWARSVAERVVDHNLNLVIRRPLFERAVFPAMLAGYEVRMPGAARWLAGLANQLRNNPRCLEALRLEGGAELGLLRAAIEHDPGDRRSRLRLIDKIVGQLRDSIHEIPSGVLYGIDGATPGQCRELEAELDEFCRLATREGVLERYTNLIEVCRLHYREYRHYLLHGKKGEGYVTYLSRPEK